jgi:hypothetical protein
MLPELDADYFISTYKQDGYRPVHTIDNPIAYHFFDHVDTTSANINDILNKYNPKSIIISDDTCIENIKNKFGDALTYSGVIIRNVASMFYKIKQANDLKKQYEIDNNFKYDFVFRYRFDTKLDSITFNRLDTSMYIKNKGESSFYDMMYGGNSYVMDIASNCFDWMMQESIENLAKLKDAEHILFQYLKKSLPHITLNDNFKYTFYSLRDGTYTI